MTSPRSWRLELAYDTLPLSLNDRRHHMVRWRESRNLRDRVRMLCRHHRIPRLKAISVEMHWTPRTKRTRDRDNAVATQKAAVDGLRDYPARKKDGRIVEPAWRGVVADDDPTHVDYGMPIIHPPNPDPWFTDRLVLVITERTDPRA